MSDPLSHDDVVKLVVSHEHALFGYTDRERVTHVPGLLEEFNDMKGQQATLVAVGKWGLGVATSILIGLTIEGANNFFGWWGAAHAASQASAVLTKVH